MAETLKDLFGEPDKELISTQSHVFLKWYGDAHVEKRNKQYVATFDKDTKLVKKMISAVGLEETKVRALDFLTDEDSYMERFGYTIGNLWTRFNAYPRKANSNGQTNGTRNGNRPNREITHDDIRDTIREANSLGSSKRGRTQT